MKQILLRKVTAGSAAVLVIALCIGATPPASVAQEWSRPLKVGEMAPDFALIDAQGQVVTLKGLADGKYVILDFYMGSF